MGSEHRAEELRKGGELLQNCGVRGQIERRKLQGGCLNRKFFNLRSLNPEIKTERGSVMRNGKKAQGHSSQQAEYL